MIKSLLISLIRLYQQILSPDHSWLRNILASSHCKYRPTCSEYCISALEKKGVFWGCIMGIWRIMRCNPWSKGGYDPVN